MSEYKKTRPHSIGFISLGCPKALYDSERILTQLRAEGYQIAGDYQQADLVIVNTCGFIDDAKAESLQAIGEAINENGKVIVTGCLGVKENEIRALHPQVLSVTGPQAYQQVVDAVHQQLQPAHDPFVDLVPAQGIKLTPKHYAYLKISEGCNHHCSFCIIPSMRGDLVSRPIGEVLDEAQRLADAGVREILVISQDTSAYGVDIKYRTGFWQGRPIKTKMQDLCEALGNLGIWIRLHYVYPYPHIDSIIPLMAKRKILPYLDVPFQHADHEILKKMRRPAAAESNLERIKAWRDICPDITIRSTFIVGFPGETETQFETLLEFLQEAKLDRVGCFKYSPVEGAAANNLPGQVDAEIKQQRWERFMQTQAGISAERLQLKVGKQIPVLIDQVDASQLVGRSYADAPEIDGNVYIKYYPDVNVGDVVNVFIEQADEYDLWGQIV
ncbi:MAG: 30S ribosomal protein S12 methylthiotransferase RimO [Gammaproteobacteria bacterium]|nr:30S ribosomal protein S12 methylthiotransferase RimO [Gammaproteobacteria bacterium]